jgi:hypothetical protein
MPSNPVSGGDCVSYNGTAISIENTESGKELQWVEWTKSDGTKLLICDRCLVANISWNNINSAGFITGKEITIDGQKYKMRALTGSTGASGTYGTGTDNEWDQMMDAIGESNDIWHWSNMYTWCQEVYYSNSSYRSVRGYSAARNYGGDSASYTYSHYGWRPALEVLNSAPKIEPSSKDYGGCVKAPEITLNVTDDDGDAYTGVIKLDGTQKTTFSGTASGTHKIPVSDWWGSMSNAAHTITVTVTDANSAATTVTYTVTKTNSPAEAPTLTKPATGQRTKAEFYAEFTVGSDADGDTQTITAETADNSSFTSAKEHTGLQKLVGDEWTDVTSITNDDAGASCRIKISGLTEGTKQYLRIKTVDDGSGFATYSAAVQIAVGDVLELTTIPAEWDSRPECIAVKFNATIDPKATVEVWVSNNADDEEAVWEVYETGRYHTFTNKEKTADKWATAVRVKVTANDATGEISISGIATGVL